MFKKNILCLICIVFTSLNTTRFNLHAQASQHERPQNSYKLMGQFSVENIFAVSPNRENKGIKRVTFKLSQSLMKKTRMKHFYIELSNHSTFFKKNTTYKLTVNFFEDPFKTTHSTLEASQILVQIPKDLGNTSIWIPSVKGHKLNLSGSSFIEMHHNDLKVM